MIGQMRLNNIQYCIERIIDDEIVGDFIETGIWRGGACIFMAGLLYANNITDKKIFCADSFEGVPKPTNKNDEGLDISKDVLPILSVSKESVEELFQRYNLLNDNVFFIKGWFKDTLHIADINKLSLLRLDGDLYESTMDSLIALYHKVSIGGFIIVDDYFSCPPCKLAIDEFRFNKNIQSSLIKIDEHSVYWRK
jgi:O-methyltransferase